jgi:NADH-quinone oxidoreductase subunit M
MGFVILGLLTLNEIGLHGAVLQMFSHGIIAGLLFAVVGRMVYDRTHTRELTLLEGMRLSKGIPFAAVTFAIAGVASMGLPGFSGFVAELQVIIGAWHAFPSLTIIVGVGIIIGVAYILRAMVRAFFSDTPQVEKEPHDLEPISIPERFGAAILIACTLVIGLYPRLLLDLIIPSFQTPLFEKLLKGGVQ